MIFPLPDTGGLESRGADAHSGRLPTACGLPASGAEGPYRRPNGCCPHRPEVGCDVNSKPSDVHEAPYDAEGEA